MPLKQWLENSLHPANYSSSLLPRVISATIIVPVFFLTPFISPVLFQIILWASATIAAKEWLRMVTPSFWQKDIIIASAFILIFALVSFLVNPAVSFILMSVCALLILGAKKYSLPERGWLIFGLFYITGAIYALSFLSDPIAIVFMLVGVAFADIGAFFVGKTFGGPRLWPEVSPKKTWSGFFGGLVASALAGLVFALVMKSEMPAVTVIAMILVALVGQAGDLLESRIKRHHKIKDTGSLLPGHGGILDRVDGYLLVAPLFVLALYLMAPFRPW